MNLEKLSNKAKEIALEMTVTAQEKICELDLTIADHCAVTNLTHGFAYAVMIVSQYDNIKNSVPFPQFKAHCLGAIEMALNSLVEKDGTPREEWH